MNFFLNFRNQKFFEFSKFEVSGIAQIGKWRNFEIFFQFGKSKFGLKKKAILESFIHSIFRTIRNFANFSNLSNSKILEFYKLDISRIFQIEIFWNFPNCKFLEFSKPKIFRIFQIQNFWNCPNCKMKKYSVLEIPVLKIPNKYPYTWSTAQLWYKESFLAYSKRFKIRLRRENNFEHQRHYVLPIANDSRLRSLRLVHRQGGYTLPKSRDR